MQIFMPLKTPTFCHFPQLVLLIWAKSILKEPVRRKMLFDQTIDQNGFCCLNVVLSTLLSHHCPMAMQTTSLVQWTFWAFCLEGRWPLSHLLEDGLRTGIFLNCSLAVLWVAQCSLRKDTDILQCGQDKSSLFSFEFGSPWFSLHLYVVFNCCMWIIPRPQCDRWNSHAEPESESFPYIARGEWTLPNEPCWIAPCGGIWECAAFHVVRTRPDHDMKERDSSATPLTPCCPEGIAVVWKEEGSCLCCCQEGELCPTWLTWALALAQVLPVGVCGTLVSPYHRDRAARLAAKGANEAEGWVGRQGR